MDKIKVRRLGPDGKVREVETDDPGIHAAVGRLANRANRAPLSKEERKAERDKG